MRARNSVTPEKRKSSSRTLNMFFSSVMILLCRHHVGMFIFAYVLCLCYTDTLLRFLLLLSPSYFIKAAWAGSVCTMSDPVTNHLLPEQKTGKQKHC